MTAFGAKRSIWICGTLNNIGHIVSISGGEMARYWDFSRKILPILCVSFGLSGCMAAALPLIAAEVGAVGFSGYKLFQTSTGGSIGVRFRSKDGKELPPEPLPAVRRVAVWPGDRGNVLFADELAKAGHLSVTPPGRTSQILARAKVATDLRMLTEQEVDSGFAAICRATHSGLVFASRSRGHKSDTSTFSLSRPTLTYSADLLGYSCDQHATIWHDEISLVIELSDSNIPSDDEINRIGAHAWADRALTAMGKSTTVGKSTSRSPN